MNQRIVQGRVALVVGAPVWCSTGRVLASIVLASGGGAAASTVSTAAVRNCETEPLLGGLSWLSVEIRLLIFSEMPVATMLYLF